MSDLLERIQQAQIIAREQALLNGQNVEMASIHAGEQAVIEHLRSMELQPPTDKAE
jgi:hypothetical protein